MQASRREHHLPGMIYVWGGRVLSVDSYLLADLLTLWVDPEELVVRGMVEPWGGMNHLNLDDQRPG